MCNFDNPVASTTNDPRVRRSAPTNDGYTVAVATKGCRAYDPDFDAWVASGAVVSIWAHQCDQEHRVQHFYLVTDDKGISLTNQRQDNETFCNKNWLKSNSLCNNKTWFHT